MHRCCTCRLKVSVEQLRAQATAPSRFVACAAYGDGGPWYILTDVTRKADMQSVSRGAPLRSTRSCPVESKYVEQSRLMTRREATGKRKWMPSEWIDQVRDNGCLLKVLSRRSMRISDSGCRQLLTVTAGHPRLSESVLSQRHQSRPVVMVHLADFMFDAGRDRAAGARRPHFLHFGHCQRAGKRTRSWHADWPFNQKTPVTSRHLTPMRSFT